MKALGVFNEALAYYGRLQQEGAIESFEPVLLTPHGGDLAGFLLVRGERGKLEALKVTDEFARINARANMIVESLGVIDASIGASLAAAMGTFAAQVADLA